MSITKIKFEPYGDLVDQAFWQCNKNLINNRDLQSQIKKDEIPELENPNKDET